MGPVAAPRLLEVACGHRGRLFQASAHEGAEGGSDMSSSKRTWDHAEIRQWVEARDGRPARVRSTGEADDAGVLRIDFPEGNEDEEELEEITWDEFFEKFEEKGLAFVYQDRTQAGEPSRFNKLVSR
jgi:hypothetical protein